MAIDSNMPYSRVNVQANHNDTIWNGAAIGAGAGLGAVGLTYGATTHGARALSNLNYKVAGNKTIREQMRADRLREAGRPYLSEATLQGLQDYRFDKADVFSNRMGAVNHFGQQAFGSKRKLAGAATTGLMGGMLAGAGIDYFS